jgi:hypothetical protein
MLSTVQDEMIARAKHFTLGADGIRIPETDLYKKAREGLGDYC